MKYTEEEKKAIKDLKSFLKFLEETYITKGKIYLHIEVLVYNRKNLDIILNLLEKNKKEIERLQNKDKEYMRILNNNLEWQEKYKELKNDSIPKDKIIKRIDNFFDDIIFVKDINELKKLLKEKLLGE